eukprot:516919-Lingulodinium_polyedra.AAC.1
MVAIGALEKGRSSRSPGFMALCRRAAAYQLGCCIQWRLRYVNTKFNVADGRSRRFEKGSDALRYAAGPAAPGP